MSIHCAICGRLNFSPENALCSDHYRQWTVSGVYTETTSTGTFLNPPWLMFLIAEQNRTEKKRYNREIPFSLLDDHQ